MLIVFNDMLRKLSEAGWSAYRLQKERQISNGTISRIRAGESISTATIDKICELCNCQPGDLMQYTPKEKDG